MGRHVGVLGATNPNVLVLNAHWLIQPRPTSLLRCIRTDSCKWESRSKILVGAAVGLASVGFIPWLSTFTVFFTHRAADPIRMLAAQTHANIKIGAAYSGVLRGLTGKTHQDVQDLAIMRAMPDMVVLAPVDSAECEAAMRWATAHNGPVYLRLARDVCPDMFDPSYEFVPGRTIRLKEGTDVLLVSTGPQTYRCKEAADQLAKETIPQAFFIFLRSSRLTPAKSSRPVKDHGSLSRSKSIVFTAVLEAWSRRYCQNSRLEGWCA